MKIIKSYTAGWAISLNSKRLISLVYLSYLILALLLVIPFYKLFVSVTGNSILPDDLVQNFNATVFGDFMREGGKVFMFFLKAMLPWLILFLILGSFFQGGILYWISNPKGRFSSRMFIHNCVSYFWPFIKTTFYTLILQLILGIIVYLPVSLLVGRENLTDDYIGKTIIIAAAIHIVLLIWGTMIAEFTRFFIYRSGNRKVLKSIWKAIKFCIKRIFSLYSLYLMWVVLPLLLFLIFYLVRVNWAIDTGLMIFLLFLVQQLFIWLRFLLKIQKTSIFYHYLDLVSGNA